MSTGDNTGQGFPPPSNAGDAQQTPSQPQPTTPLPGYTPPGQQTYYDPGMTRQVGGDYVPPAGTTPNADNVQYTGYPGNQANTGYTGQGYSAAPNQIPPQQPYSYYDPRAAKRAARDARRAARGNRVPIVGPLLLITAGVLFLLNNMGIVDWSIWGSLWRLWPLLLVIIGIDMLVGRRSPVLSFLLVVIIIGAGAAFLYSLGAFEGSGSQEQLPLNVPLDGAKSANMQIDLSSGQLSIDDGDTGSALATGTLDYYSKWGEPSVSANTSGQTVDVRVKQSNNDQFAFFATPNESLNWDIHLNPEPQVTLKINTGTGRSDLNLEKLHVTNLNLNSGTGSTTITLPAQAGNTNASVNGGLGSVDIVIPAGVEAHIKVNGGLGSVDVDSRFNKTGDKTYESSGYNSTSAKNKLNLDINAGVGSVNVSSQ